MESSALVAADRKLTRAGLALIPTPPGSTTHKTIPHIEVVNAVIETLGFRHIRVVSDEYAVLRDGMKMCRLLELDQTFTGCRLQSASGTRTTNRCAWR